MGWFQFRNASLARRFALASAALAAGALLVISVASWWLINSQHASAVEELGQRERQFRAAAVGSDLNALATRMTEVATSSILATGLVDSAGRETYLAPFLSGIQQINGIPVQVQFTDYEGKEIASNAAVAFSADQYSWLRRSLQTARASSRVFVGPTGPELVAFEPLLYNRTASPEGGLLYKIALRDIQLDPHLQLQWHGSGVADGARMAAIATPPIFQPLQFRIEQGAAPSQQARLAPQYLQILVVALLVFGAVVVAGRTLARHLTRDLRALEAFSSRVMRSGLGPDRAPVGGSAEVASLALSINEMLDRLYSHHAELLGEREKLTELTQALQAADQRKDEFLAMLAHELRNPLSPITTGAELLRRNAGADKQLARTADVISRQAEQMTKIVDDLLDVSRVTRGLVGLDRQMLELGPVVAAAVDQVATLADAKRQTIEVTLPPQPTRLYGDASRLIQVLGNLLNNAARYTQEGGHISLSASCEGGRLNLTVRDNGCGIEPELMPVIFDLFSQGRRSADRAQGGLGLGLALVKHLVELHGGSIRASSAGLGLGTSFTVTLPLATPDNGTAAAPVEPDRTVESAGKGLRVMIVDDNVDAADTLASLLELAGHQVKTANDGPSTLALAPDFRPDVFILDIGLPGMDGLELAHRLREDSTLRHALRVALTGYGQSGDRDRTAAAGFQHHLVKPVDPQALLDLLARETPGPSPPQRAARTAQLVRS